MCLKMDEEICGGKPYFGVLCEPLCSHTVSLKTVQTTIIEEISCPLLLSISGSMEYVFKNQCGTHLQVCRDNATHASPQNRNYCTETVKYQCCEQTSSSCNCVLSRSRVPDIPQNPYRTFTKI